jgi:hypothetical protein
MYWFLFLVSLVFAVLRFIVPVSGKINKQDVYKDLAHLWVGFLLGFCFYDFTMRYALEEDLFNWQLWWLPLALTAVEVVAFLFRKSGGR